MSVNTFKSYKIENGIGIGLNHIRTFSSGNGPTHQFDPDSDTDVDNLM